MRKKKLSNFIIYSVIFHLIIIAGVLIYLYKHPLGGGKSGTVMVGIVSNEDISSGDVKASSEISEDQSKKTEAQSTEAVINKEPLEKNYEVKKSIEKKKEQKSAIQKEPQTIAKDKPKTASASSVNNIKANRKESGSETASDVNQADGVSENSVQIASIGNDTTIAYPNYSLNPKPKYPRTARKRGYEGEVKLKVFVLPNGKVGKIEILRPSGYEILDESALEAVKKWVFVPGKENGKEISSWVTVPITFQLKSG